jgi:hypothetical protein
MGPAILVWRGSSGTIVEGNMITNCMQGIALGYTTDQTPDHTGGIIRNNMVSRTAAQSGDFGIGVNNSANTKVFNNSVILSGTYTNAIEYRFAGTSGVMIEANLTDGAITARDGATGTVSNNATTATGALFVNASIGDLHLVAGATLAIDRAVTLADVTDDYDGTRRPIGPAPDLGAHEFGGGTLAPAAPTALTVQ